MGCESSVRIKVMVVDDNRNFLNNMVRFLGSDMRIEVVGTASSGSSAIEKARECSPSLVFMDVAMPGMNGLDAARQLKAAEPSVSIVILTLYDTVEYREKAAESGADFFIPKEEFMDRFDPLMNSLLTDPRFGCARANPQQDLSAYEGRETVLLADEDQRLRELTGALLNNYGYCVVAAASAEEALREFRAYESSISLLIFDYLTSGRNGHLAYESMRKLRPGIPAIFMAKPAECSADSGGGGRNGRRFIPKPVRPVPLLTLMREMLDKGVA